MNTSFVEFDRFKDDLKRLIKKYPHIEVDIGNTLRDFFKNPQLARPLVGFEGKLFKLRIKSTDQRKGKSGGFRLIFYLNSQQPEKIYLLTIYPKNERADLSFDELWSLYTKLLKLFMNR